MVILMLQSTIGGSSLRPAIAPPSGSAQDFVRNHPPVCTPSDVYDIPDEPPLTPDGLTVADMTGRWMIARMRPRHVKAYALDLLKIARINGGGVGFLCPLVAYRAVGSRRTHRLPMFHSMLPVCIWDETLELDPKNRTSKPLLVPDSAQPRLREDLTRVEFAALNDPTRIEPHPFATVGKTVRVVTGAYAGFCGPVVYRGKNGRQLVIQIQFMQQALALDLDDDTVIEPVSE